MPLTAAGSTLRGRAGQGHFNHTVHGARGLFALFIFIYHIVNSGYATWPFLTLRPIDFLLRSTEFGVELFFCISGYVICGALRRAGGPLAFLEDRSIRIYPALWASIGAIIGIGLLRHGPVFGFVIGQVPARHVVMSLLALPGILPVGSLNPVGWSLSYEMCFYVFCAAGWSMRRAAGRVSILVLAPVAAVMLALYPRSIFLLSGVLAAEGYLADRRVQRLAQYPVPWLLSFLILWRAIQVLSLPREFTETTLFGWALDVRLPLALLAFIAATLGFAGLAAGHGGLGRLLRTRLFQYFGTISYSFYLWHIIVVAVVASALRNTGLLDRAGDAVRALLFIAALPPSVIVAHASQRVLERGAGVWLRRRLHHAVPFQVSALKAEAALKGSGGRR